MGDPATTKTKPVLMSLRFLPARLMVNCFQVGVNVVLTGHEHFYERIKPQKGIAYFIVGSSAKVRRGDLTKTNLTAKGWDQGYSFMLTAVDGKVAGNGSPDRFRIKISRYDDALKQDVVVYDNQLSASGEGTASEGTAIASGNIVVHATKN